MQRVYAQALQHLLSEGKKESELFKELVAHLKARGRLKLLPGIKRELERAQARSRKQFAKLEVSAEKETAHALKELKSLGIEVSGSKVNHDLISGWRTIQAGKLIDRSAKQQLVDLYRNVTRS